MQYETIIDLRNLDLDDAYDMQNENDNMNLIDETLKNMVDNVDIELNAAVLL